MKAKPGDRITLIELGDDPYPSIQPGDKGTVIDIDDIGTVCVDWDNGSGLGLVPGIGRFVIEPKQK